LRIELALAALSMRIDLTGGSAANHGSVMYEIFYFEGNSDGNRSCWPFARSGRTAEC